MPITKDRFDRISDEDARLDGNADSILDFLIRNEDKAYTKREIAEETSVATLSSPRTRSNRARVFARGWFSRQSRCRFPAISSVQP